MNPGQFRQRLEFKYVSEGTDEFGFPIEEEILYSKAWAKLKTLRGNTFFAAATVNMEHNREFVIRFQQKLTDEERPHNLKLYWKGKEHEIESIENDDGLNKTMTVIARAVT